MSHGQSFTTGRQDRDCAGVAVDFHPGASIDGDTGAVCLGSISAAAAVDPYLDVLQTRASEPAHLSA